MRTIEEIKADIETAIASHDTERMNELYREKALFYMRNIPLNRLEEICNAEREDRCVTLPCNVGDTVYLIIHGYAEETKVRTFFVGHPSYNRGEPDPRYEMIRCTNFDLPMKDFGKTVFLTR